MLDTESQCWKLSYPSSETSQLPRRIRIKKRQSQPAGPPHWLAKTLLFEGQSTGMISNTLRKSDRQAPKTVTVEIGMPEY